MKDNAENKIWMGNLYKFVGVLLSLTLAHFFHFLLDANNVWWDYYKNTVWLEIVLSILVGVVIYAIIFGVINLIFNRVDRNPVTSNNVITHFLITTVIVIISMILLLQIEAMLFNCLSTKSLQDTKELEQEFRNYIVVNVIVAVFVNSFYNLFVFFERWKVEMVESSKLAVMASEQKANALQAELEVLKLQLDPHFLFNNFSLLTQLIETDKAKASLFLSNLSQVYRYILTNGKKDMTTLDEEIKFVSNYFHLIKIRLGNTIDLIINISDNDKKEGIPPVTLQLLIENAIKHNVSTANQPLIIKIESSNEGFITVINNLQRINIDYGGTGIGLANICERYKLLDGIIPQIIETEQEFIVRLPILNF